MFTPQPMSSYGSETYGPPNGAIAPASGLGTSAGGQAFWASTGGAAALMIGHDDEAWDITVTIPFDVIDHVVDETERLRAPPPR